MDHALIEAFNKRVFDSLLSALSELPHVTLTELHGALVDEYEKTEGSDQEPPVSFALQAVTQALRAQDRARAMN